MSVIIQCSIVIFWLSPGTYEHVSMLCKMAEHICYAPAQGALSDDAVWHLSVAYIRPKLRMERPRKTKIGTEIAHVTRYSNTTFKVKRSRSPGRFGWLYWQANMDIELVTDPYACMVCIMSPFAGLGGGILWRPPAYSLFCLVTRFTGTFLHYIRYLLANR